MLFKTVFGIMKLSLEIFVKGEIRCRRCMFRILQIELIRQQVYRCPLRIQRHPITPFQKVLEKENALYAAASEENSKSASVKKTTAKTTEKTSSASKTSKTSNDTSESTGSTTLKSIFERAAEKYDISYDFLVAVARLNRF